MGLAIPQIITPSKASGAQVIDGSLKFDGTSTYLEKTPSSQGNRRTFTFSCWTKRSKFAAYPVLFSAGASSATSGYLQLSFEIDPLSVYIRHSGGTWVASTSAVFRDTSWYHIVMAVDTTAAAASDRVKLYVNGAEQLISSLPTITENFEFLVNNNGTLHQVGAGKNSAGTTSVFYDGHLSNVYFIDGQALGPEYFGFTDPLTNTWKPKKYTGTFGTNGFYLPMDGNSPIGQDQSGQGNDWTPVNFGGSVALDNPQVSGAKPILNTTQGGTQAGVGVFGSKQNVGYAVTVYNDGGGNKYYIDGVKQDTVTGLIRGATYTFDTSDSTVSSHPFRFSATSNGSHGGGSEYTNGVAAITGAATTITVPYNAPNTLYYYCTSHSGMGADITGITTNEKLADQYASHCTLALPLVGADDDVCASIACTSTTNSITNSGVDFVSTYSNFYGGSADFTGASTDVLYTASDNTKYQMGTGDFTVECWVYSTSTSGTQNIFQVYKSSGSKYYGVYYSSSSLRFQIAGSGGAEVNVGNIVMGKNKWTHIAMVRDGGTLRAFVDGVQVGSGSVSADINEDGYVAYVGRHQPSNNGFTGYMQEFRIYKGVAKYTSDFVVPSRSPDILPDTPSGVSGNSKLAKITDGGVSFDGSGDYLDVGSSSDYQFGTGDFTFEGYFYANNFTNRGTFIDGRDTGNTTGLTVGHEATSGQIRVYMSASDGSDITVQSDNFSTNKWTHVAVSRDSGTVRLFVDGILQQSATRTSDLSNTNNHRLGYKHYSSSSFNYFDGFMSNVRIIKGTALYTSRFTPPTAPLTNVTNTKLLCCQSNKSSAIAAASPNISGVNNGTAWSSTVTGPTRVEDRVANAFNGSTSGPGAIPAYPGTLTFAPGLTGLTTVKIYGYYAGSGVTLHVNGSQQSPSSGAFTLTISTSTLDSVVWTATNGFNYMRIDAIEIDSTVLIDPVVGPDDSNEAATTFNPFNTDINTVRGQETGYATLNPLINGASTLSDGNLTATAPSGSTHGRARSTLTMDTSGTGKFYFEATLTVFGSTYPHIGVIDSVRNSDATYVGDATNCFSYFSTGNKQLENSSSSYGDSFTTGDTLGCSLDCGSGELRFYKNGVDQGVAKTITADYHACFAVSNYGSSGQWKVNFGQKPFKFSPPDGFQPLNAANTRPVKVISRPDQYVGISTWTGDGNTGRNIKTLQFKPDLVWIKQRSATRAHALFDSVRGANKRLQSSSNNAETTHTDQMSAFIDNGFTVEDNNTVNVDSGTYVGWSWRAGGNKNTFNVDDVGYASAAAAGLTAGSVTPTGASVGTKQGFSIIKWTADDPQDNSATIPHGLTQKPDFWAIKSTTRASTDWVVYTQQIDGSLDFGHFNSTEAFANSSATAPTATTFGVYGDDINYAGATQIAYLWHSVPGLQKFGRFAGNGNSDGVYVELGFKPAILLIKNDGDTGDWIIWDNERNKTNPVNRQIWPYTTSGTYGDYDQVGSNYPLDFLSNGFKMRTTDADMNSGSRNYIYAAWAEAPSVDLYGGGANAR